MLSADEALARTRDPSRPTSQQRSYGAGKPTPCCDQMQPTFCVCIESRRCDTHNHTTCWGTHD